MNDGVEIMKYQLLLRWLFSLFCLTISPWAMAGDFNTATVPVADYSPAALEKALPHALSQVLTQMSGNPGIASIPAIQSALPKANQWMQSYSYQTASQDNLKSGVFVQVTFDQAAMTRLLKQAHQSVSNGDVSLETGAPANNKSSQVSLTLVGINSLSDYSSAIKTLQHLPDVAAVTVLQVNDQSVDVQVQIPGGSQKLVDNLDSDPHWESDLDKTADETVPPTSSPISDNDQKPELRYRWMGNE